MPATLDRHSAPVIPPSALGVITNIEGQALTHDDRELLRSPAVSGLILFSRNFSSIEQLQSLSADVKTMRPDLPLFVDQEGGRVQRFREGFTRLPAMLSLETLWLEQPQLAVDAAQKLGWLMAWELGCCGVDVSFAPVLDIERGVSRVIGDRGFATDAARVSLLTRAFVAGMADAGMKAVGKHFPGHGAIEADSHLEFPVDLRSLAQLDYDMRPFRYLIQHGVMAGVMPAHVLYPALDNRHTAGFSSRWMQMLRQSLGFNGVIFSDDLSMAGAAHYGDYAVRTELAAQAGCQALVTCNDRDGAWAVIHTVERLQSQNFSSLSLLDWCRDQPDSFRQQQAQAEQIRTALVDAGLIAADPCHFIMKEHV
ncbi:MAG: beta-N-acetylhexosaminidase [Oceanobacter sp.]